MSTNTVFGRTRCCVLWCALRLTDPPRNSVIQTLDPLLAALLATQKATKVLCSLFRHLLSVSEQ